VEGRGEGNERERRGMGEGKIYLFIFTFNFFNKGIAYNASRLTIYHFKGSPVNESCQSKSIIAFVTGDSNSASQFSQLLEIAQNATLVENSRNSKSAWNVTVDINSAKYSISSLFIFFSLLFSFNDL
jgi:hypothetical protein